jgi:putative toxin-antitoxin system antitoxin component (TIGR02293 family)
MKTAKKPAKNRGNGPKAFPWAGIIASHVHGAKTKEAEALRATPVVIQAVQRGLPFDELEALRAALDLPLDKLAPKLGMSLATLHRRKQEGRLTQAESDRLMRYARLMGTAVQVFRDEQYASEWLKHPQFGLAWSVPLDYAESEMGAREVENLLWRIAYGVYS